MYNSIKSSASLDYLKGVLFACRFMNSYIDNNYFNDNSLVDTIYDANDFTICAILEELSDQEEF